MAMLRVGDAVYVDGVEMRVIGSTAPELPGAALHEPTSNGTGDPRVVLRGVGGQYHGRSFTLEQPRLVGRSSDADIRIDDPSFADRHARLDLLGDDIILRDLGSAEGTLVNGEPMRDALLRPGDQVVFDAHHRFVVEAPMRGRTPGEHVRDEGERVVVVVDGGGGGPGGVGGPHPVRGRGAAAGPDPGRVWGGRRRAGGGGGRWRGCGAGQAGVTVAAAVVVACRAGDCGAAVGVAAVR